jgi:hypothetical protein
MNDGIFGKECGACGNNHDAMTHAEAAKLNLDRAIEEYYEASKKMTRPVVIVNHNLDSPLGVIYYTVEEAREGFKFYFDTRPDDRTCACWPNVTAVMDGTDYERLWKLVGGMYNEEERQQHIDRMED